MRNPSYLLANSVKNFHALLTSLTTAFLRIARLAFLALILLVPFRARFTIAHRTVGIIYGDYTDFLLFASDIVLLLTLVFWLAAKTLGRGPLRRPPWLVTIPLVAFTLIAGLSALTSIDPALSGYHWLRLILLAGLVFYIADQVDSIESLFPAIALQVALQAFVAIGQFLRQTDLGIQNLGEYLLNPDWPGVSIVFDTSQRWLRAYGLSDHPNILGGCLAFGLVLLFGAHFRGGETSRQQTLWIFPVFVLGALALFYTFSRSAWVAFAIAGLTVFVHNISKTDIVNKRRFALFVLATTLILAPFAYTNRDLISTRLPTVGSQDISPTELQAIGERTILNEASINEFLNHPILGVGLGALPQAIRLANPVFTPYYQPAHIVFIAAAAETGLLGVTTYAFLLAAPWLMLAFSRSLRASTSAWLVAAGLLAVAVVGLFDYYPWLLQPGRLWQYLLLGLWAVVSRPQP